MINYTSTFTLNRQKYHYIDLVKASKDYDIEFDSLPYTIKILLERQYQIVVKYNIRIII